MQEGGLAYKHIYIDFKIKLGVPKNDRFTVVFQDGIDVIGIDIVGIDIKYSKWALNAVGS